METLRLRRLQEPSRVERLLDAYIAHGGEMPADRYQVHDPSGLPDAVAPAVDGILLDSGNPSLPVKELGGKGRTHDWRLSRRIREAVDVPVFLAGGLHAGNVAEAIDRVGPFGVDVCSGVRTNGRLDEEKLAEFFRRVPLV